MAGIKVGVKKTVRLRQPKLDGGQLQEIGDAMVAKQKARWGAGINAEDRAAKPLSKRYTFIKAKIRRTNRPKRDMNLSGLLLSNFTLRKAINGVIRAEPTSRKAREHARPANNIEQMIGLSGSDSKVIYDRTQAAFGDLAKTMVIPVG
jgi:hypothetical protein